MASCRDLTFEEKNLNASRAPSDDSWMVKKYDTASNVSKNGYLQESNERYQKLEHMNERYQKHGAPVSTHLRRMALRSPLLNLSAFDANVCNSSHPVSKALLSSPFEILAATCIRTVDKLWIKMVSVVNVKLAPIEHHNTHLTDVCENRLRLIMWKTFSFVQWSTVAATTLGKCAVLWARGKE